jgi:hypothetical protein
MMQCASKSLPNVIVAAFPEYDLGSVGDIVKRGQGSGLVVLRDRLEVLLALSEETCTHIIAPVDCSVVGAAYPVTLVRACAESGMALDLAQVLDTFSLGQPMYTSMRAEMMHTFFDVIARNREVKGAVESVLHDVKVAELDAFGIGNVLPVSVIVGVDLDELSVDLFDSSVKNEFWTADERLDVCRHVANLVGADHGLGDGRGLVYSTMND